MYKYVKRGGERERERLVDWPSLRSHKSDARIRVKRGGDREVEREGEGRREREREPAPFQLLQGLLPHDFTVGVPGFLGGLTSKVEVKAFEQSRDRTKAEPSL